MSGCKRFPGEWRCHRGYWEARAGRGFSLEARPVASKRWLMVDLDAGRMVPASESGEWL
jgi:hypothetical protein